MGVLLGLLFALPFFFDVRGHYQFLNFFPIRAYRDFVSSPYPA